MKKPERFFIIGTMGSGKTTLAKKIANLLGIKHNSLDEVYWTTKYTRKRNPKKREQIINRIIKKERHYTKKMDKDQREIEMKPNPVFA